MGSTAPLIKAYPKPRYASKRALTLGLVAPFWLALGAGACGSETDAREPVTATTTTEQAIVSEECAENACTPSDPCALVKPTVFRCFGRSGACTCVAKAGSCGKVGVCNAPPCAEACTGTSSCASNNFCASAGRVTTCDDYGVCDRGNCESFCGGGPPLYAIRQCAAACTAGGGAATTCGAMGHSCIGDLTTGGGTSPPCSTCTYASAPTQQCIDGSRNSTCGAQHVYAPVTVKGMQDKIGGADSNRCVN